MTYNDITQLDIETIKNIINTYDVISFDIFDTLLIRSFIKPNDIWKYIELKYNILGFAKNREKNNIGDYQTLDDIFLNMPYDYQKYKKIEINTEIDLIEKNPYLVRIWNISKKLNKKRIITTDMYLPYNILKKMLNNNGIDGWDSFYLSCKDKIRKNYGSTFKKICEDYKNLKILHIGDNQYSDIIMPSKFGIDTIYVNNIVQKFIDTNIFLKNILEKDNSLQFNALISYLAIAELNYRYLNNHYSALEKIGCLLGSVLIQSFIQMVLKTIQCKKIKKLVFISRDGYVLKHIFDSLNITTVQTIYAYAPRLVRATTNINIIEQYKKYVKYLNLDINTTAIVDTITRNFTAQYLLRDENENEPFAFIFMPIDNTIKNGISLFPVNSFIKYCHLIEFLCTAPHPPVDYVIQNTPVFKENICIDEKINIEKYKILIDSEIYCSQFLITKMKKLNFDISSKQLLEYLNTSLQNLPEDIRLELKSIKNGGLKHEQYLPII